MEALKEKKQIHNGNNVRSARIWKKVTQQDLADRLSLQQSEISTLETQSKIDDKILDNIAKALNVPVDFFKEFEPEATMKSYTNTSNENADCVSVFQGENDVKQNNTYYPLDKVTELYERLLKEQEEKILLRQQIEELKKK